MAAKRRKPVGQAASHPEAPDEVFMVEAEVTAMSVQKNGVIDVRYEVRGDKELGLSGSGVIRMREGLAVKQGQRLYIAFEPGPMVRHGMGDKGVMNLSASLQKATGRVRQEQSNG